MSLKLAVKKNEKLNTDANNLFKYSKLKKEVLSRVFEGQSFIIKMRYLTNLCYI